MTGEERHRRALERTFAWAEESAAQGQLDDALGWLQLVEFVEGDLPPDWEEQRQAWLRARGTHADARA